MTYIILYITFRKVVYKIGKYIYYKKKLVYITKYYIKNICIIFMILMNLVYIKYKLNQSSVSLPLSQMTFLK